MQPEKLACKSGLQFRQAEPLLPCSRQVSLVHVPWSSLWNNSCSMDSGLFHELEDRKKGTQWFSMASGHSGFAAGSNSCCSYLESILLSHHLLDFCHAWASKLEKWVFIHDQSNLWRVSIYMGKKVFTLRLHTWAGKFSQDSIYTWAGK